MLAFGICVVALRWRDRLEEIRLETAMTGKVSWGVLGVAQIAVEKVIPAMQLGAVSRVDAIASRDINRARRAAAALGVARAYRSYDELLADPRSRRSTILFPTNCMSTGRCARWKPESTCCAKSRSR
jgi:hypothetical protein